MPLSREDRILMKMDDGLWIRRYDNASPGALRLICLPHAGGSASFYLPVSRSLRPAIEVLAVQYPGRQDRRGEPCVDDIPTLARQIAGALSGWTRLPYALFGHSMGATVAYELARLLEHEQGRPPVWLFASGRRAPSRVRDERVHQLGDDQLVADLRRLSGTDDSILGDEEILRMILPAVRSDYRAAETYRWRPGPALSCPVTCLYGDADPKVTEDEVLAWAGHTTGPFEHRAFHGGHFYLVRHQAEILELLAGRLSSRSARPAPNPAASVPGRPAAR
jgi:pyochelin biosynthetic protein PchC